MKKILSVLLCVVMLGAMFCASASAANALKKNYDDAKAGDLLYDVVFNAKDGVFVPGVISKAKDCAIQTSDDGKTLTITHDNDTALGWYAHASDADSGTAALSTVLRSAKARATRSRAKSRYSESMPVCTSTTLMTALHTASFTAFTAADRIITT